jgi:hypothetical protein
VQRSLMLLLLRWLRGVPQWEGVDTSVCRCSVGSL